MSATAIAGVRKRHRATSYKWGFTWALFTAICWGASFMPSGAAWYEKPFTEIPLLVGAAIMTAVGSFFIVCYMLIWLACTGKLSEYWLTIRNFRNISIWYFVAAIFGGPMAYFGMYIAMGYVGPIFAILASLMYPAVGALTARIWYKEKITRRCALGIFTIILGGLVLYAPGILSELTGGGSGKIMGYIGGLMCAVVGVWKVP